MDSDTYNRAWFPADEVGEHWIELTYAEPVQPERLEIWGTLAQGGLAVVHRDHSERSEHHGPFGRAWLRKD